MAKTSSSARKPKNPLPKQHQQRPGKESAMTPRPLFEAPLYKGSEKLKGLNALITGGDSGIGRAVAVLFAREGANVAITHLPSERDDAAVTAEHVLAEGTECVLLEGDLQSAAFCKSIVQKTVKAFGQLDILVNNAAYQHHQESIAEISDQQWERTFTTNITAYFRVAKAALEVMPDGGCIINTGSITGLEGSKELIDYSSTKGAIHAFTKSLAQSVVSRNIRVNCVSPGPVWTPLNVADKKATDVAKHGADTPMKRPAQPEEVAPAYVFFAAASCSSYITGEVLTLLGGETTAA
ncbi:MAG: SDR family oxidoreductase [Gemmatimonas sp.]